MSACIIPPNNPSKAERCLARNRRSLQERLFGGELAAFAGAHLLALALQLTAGGENVAAARRADRRGVAGAVEDRGEGLDRLPVRALVVGPRPRIEGDQVDLGRNALEQL